VLGNHLKQGLLCQTLERLPQWSPPPAIAIHQRGFAYGETWFQLESQNQAAKFVFDLIAGAGFWGVLCLCHNEYYTAIYNKYTSWIFVIDNLPFQEYIFIVQTGTIFDIKKYSINDGPGIRTTVFFSGCPLSCLWCHNPESISLAPELLYRKGRCLMCGACVEVCPEGAISRETNVSKSRETFDSVITDQDKCIRCQTCISVCYSGARQFSGREVTVREVMAQVEREIPFYDESGGGVTFSGGEPLMQPGFLSALLRACREQEIHTVVDTSGFANWNILEQIRQDVDLFLYDLKHMDSARHREASGVPNELILSNLRTLSERGHKIVVRVPLIPGINDDKENLHASGKFLASLPKLKSVELIGYHNIAQAKYEALSREYKLADTKPPTEEAMAGAATVLRSYKLQVTIR
jgi:pyruvate formate lyase activating enzyme